MKQRNNFFFQKYASWFFSVFILTFSFILILFDDDPPSPPFNSSISSDSFHVHPISMIANDSRINISVKVGNFSYITRSAGLKMFKVIVSIGDMLSKFEYNNFFEAKENDGVFNFRILQPIVGSMEAKLMFGERNIDIVNYNVERISFYPTGYSRALETDSLANLRDTCMINDTILFFSYQYLSSCYFHVGFNQTLKFQPVILKHEDTFLQENDEFKNISIPTLVIGANRPEPWRQILDVLLPIYDLVENNYNGIKINIYLPYNQTILVKNIEKLPNILNVFDNSTKGCFNEIQFPKSSGGIPFGQKSSKYKFSESKALAIQYEWILSFNPDLIKRFKSYYCEERQVQENTIVIDDPKYFDTLKFLYPNYEIKIIPETYDVKIIADIVSSSKFYICTKLNLMIYGIFLQEDSTFVEVQPNECIPLGAEIAKLSGCKYLSKQSFKDNNDCYDLSSYFQYQSNISLHHKLSQSDFSFLKPNDLK